MEKVHRHSGLGEVTAMSEGIIGLQTSGLNQPSHADAHKESQDVLFNVVSNLLEKTGASPSEVMIFWMNPGWLLPNRGGLSLLKTSMPAAACHVPYASQCYKA